MSTPSNHDGTPEPATIAAAWRGLEAAARNDGEHRILDLFAAEPDRLARLTLDAAGLHLDLSKQPWTKVGLDAALALARSANVEARRAALFGGERINASEDRAALHPALRSRDTAYLEAVQASTGVDVAAARERMLAFAEDVRSGKVRGATGAPFRAVVHIGIGGSDLGPRLVWEALEPPSRLEQRAPIALRFAANVDGAEIAAALDGLDPATTLVIAVSKTFTTQETLANATAGRAWLREALGEEAARAHLAAVSAAPEKAEAFGVALDRVFPFWDWVGGRFSVWSAVGLSCAIGIGAAAFEAFLAGAAAMDAHFLEAPLERNAPVLLALAQIYNRNALSRTARAVTPYARRLALLPALLQQLEMESNGKRVGPNGAPALHATAPVVFGDVGANAQHAFFQLLHQGSDIIPVEFIAVARADEGPPASQAKLLSNALAQAEALMIGRPEADVRAELQAKGFDAAAVDVLAPQRTFPGNRPSSFILMDRLTPGTLGALIALYEHKTFVEGVILGINSFDQWGVELGKALAGRVLPELEGGDAQSHDPSTTALIARLKS